MPCVFVFVFGGWGEEEMVPNSSVKNKQTQPINVFVKKIIIPLKMHLITSELVRPSASSPNDMNSVYIKQNTTNRYIKERT